MKLAPTKIAGAFVITTERKHDARGSFARFYDHADIAAALQGKAIAQVNHSVNAKAGTVRGLHYQRPPHSECKMVRCLRGAVWDVVVDLRTGSPTFLQWHAQELTAANDDALLIPEGCAHGFQTLVDDSALLYLHTVAYVPEADAGILYSDARLGINWPLQVSEISERDRNLAVIAPDFKGI